jgi:hypothetical protein
VDILSWFRQPRAASIPERNAVAQAIAERRYDHADALRQTLPPGSELRAIFELQLLIARSHYAQAAAFYEQGSRTLRAQHSARVRYLRALSALDRKDDLQKVVKAIFASRAEPENLAGLLPFMWDFPTDVRAAAAKQILSSRKPVSPDAQIACAQILLDTGDSARAQSLAASLPRATARQNAEIALLECNIALAGGDSARATKYLSDAFEAFGMEPVARRDSSEPLSPHNLTASAPPVAGGLAKTSVLMSCFNGEQTVGAAIASLQAQSHRDIEIIVVDDFSTDKSVQIVEAIAAGDPRVTLIKSPANQGAYVSRNLALARATGEFVLAHDADDWAHPRKVERLVRHLLAHPNLIAVRGEWVRFTPGAGVLHRTTYIRQDVSSMTFRREPALAKAGYFDTARINADSEYMYRLQRLFGETAIGDLKEMLSVAAYAPNSLSRASETQIDIHTGVYAPIRAAYRRAYFAWHEHAQSLYVDFPQAKGRPFAIPPELNP